MNIDPHQNSSRPRANSALCAGALERMLWAAIALAGLWVTIAWALS